MDETLPTVTESALRGIACRCPRCGKGSIYSGFLTLRPACDSCGLDFAFMDSGDGPAIFMIMISGAIVVGAALVVEIKYDQLEGRRLRHTGQFLRWRTDRDPLSCTYDQLDIPVRYDLAEVLDG